MKNPCTLALLSVLPALAGAQEAFLDPACVPIAGECVVAVGEVVAFDTVPPFALEFHYSWGDGPPEVSSSQVYFHAWGSPGLNTPSVVVFTSTGSLTATSSLPIRVIGPPDASDIPTLGDAGLCLFFVLLSGAALALLRSGRG